MSDYDAAFKLWTGETADDYFRKRTHALHSKTKDPEVIKLRKENEEVAWLRSENERLHTRLKGK